MAHAKLSSSEQQRFWKKQAEEHKKLVASGRAYRNCAAKDVTLKELVMEWEPANLDGIGDRGGEKAEWQLMNPIDELCEFICMSHRDGNYYVSEFLDKMVEKLREAKGNPNWPFAKGT